MFRDSMTAHPPLWRQPSPLRLLPALLVVMVVWGAVLSRVVPPLFTPVLGAGLFLANGLALFLLVQRARERGPEQWGWSLLAASLGLILFSNIALCCARPLLVNLTLAEMLYLGLQFAAGLLQSWALLVWPFRSSALEYRQPLNLVGSLLFSLALLMLIWGTSLYFHPGQYQGVMFLRVLVLSIRVAFSVGIAVYFLAEEPRRVKGPLGWFLIGTLVWATNLLLIRPYLHVAHAALQPSPLFALALAAPFSLILTALCKTPVEIPEPEGRSTSALVEWLIALPFLAVGLLLVLFVVGDKPHLLAISLGFMTLCVLFLVRHVFLLREARRAREILEDRVLARTKDLEALQGLLIRTERMNSVAMLGAGLAHDLNNALGIVKSCAELQQMRLERGEAVKASDISRILAAADQSAAMTRRLMAFARPDQDQPVLIDLHRETAGLEPLLRMLLPRNITLQINFRDPITPILGSRDRIEQMLVNLVSNARDAMPGGGRILLELDREGNSPESRIFMRVTDGGPGIPPELLDQIFEPFFTTKPSGKGTGLGLPSVRHTMEELGGSLEVQSEQARGTTFTLWFPPPWAPEDEGVRRLGADS